MEKKESRTGAIIGTVAAIVLCGLPGLCLLCPLSVWVFTGSFDWFGTSNFMSPGWGALFLCLAVVFIVIAVLVPVLTLRKKKVAPVEVVPPEDLPPQPPQEPLPPVS